jgi:hypothetical protein
MTAIEQRDNCAGSLVVKVIKEVVKCNDMNGEWERPMCLARLIISSPPIQTCYEFYIVREAGSKAMHCLNIRKTQIGIFIGQLSQESIQNMD